MVLCGWHTITAAALRIVVCVLPRTLILGGHSLVDERTRKGRKINAQRKGKRGELQVAKLFRDEFGWNARRRQQHSGTEGSDDVACGFDGLHVEVKFAQKWQINDWMSQAVNDCGNNLPILLHRKSRIPWIAIWPHRYTDRLFDLIGAHIDYPHLEGHLYNFIEVYGEPRKGHVYDTLLKPAIELGEKAVIVWSTECWSMSCCLATDLKWVTKLRRMRSE